MRMDKWISSALIALSLWGLWGFLPKLATEHIDAKSVLVFEVIGTIIAGLIVLFLIDFNPQFHVKGFTFAVLTGLAGALGALFFLIALKGAKVSVVATTTALYPLITIGLAALFLGESLTLKKSVGVVFALVAIVLFAS